jgi:hypothetical protein
VSGEPIELRERVAMTPEQGELFARGVLGGIAAPGYPTALQRDVIRQVAHHVAGVDLDVEALAPIEAPAIAAMVSDGFVRRRLVQCVVALELLEDPTPELARHVRQFARTLAVDEPMVNAARRVADGQLALMYADIQRNSYYTEEAKREILQGHVWRLLRSKFAYSNVVASRAIERKWATLADMPDGSLGRAVAEFYRIHHFPLPGARRGWRARRSRSPAPARSPIPARPRASATRCTGGRSARSTPSASTTSRSPNSRSPRCARSSRSRPARTRISRARSTRPDASATRTRR